MNAPHDIELALESADPEVRRRATSAISELPPADAVELVVRALGDADWRVRKEASQIALLVGPTPRLLHDLVQRLFPGDNVGLRNAVVETLAAFGAAAVPPVVAVLHRLDADGKKLAVEVLGRSQEPSAMAAIERLLDDGDANVRAAAIEAVSELGTLAVDSASRILLGSLDSAEMHIRHAALAGLNRLGVVVPWDKLRQLTSDRILRRAALIAASRAGRIEAACVLAQALEDDNPAIVRIALAGLAELALGSDIARYEWREKVPPLVHKSRERLLDALSPLASELDSRRAALVVAAAVAEPAAIDMAIDALLDEQVAREADAALRIFGTSALPRLLARVAHGDTAIRAAAIARVIDLTGPSEQDAVRLALRGALIDPSVEVVAEALTALGAIGNAEDITAVFAVLASKQSGAVSPAEKALAALAKRYPDDARLTASVARRDHGSRLATSVIIGALGGLGGEVLGSVADDVAFLAEALSSPDRATRIVAVEAVAEVGSHLGLDALLFALADEEREVQLSAVSALGRLRSDDGRPAGGDRLLELIRESTDVELTCTAVRAIGMSGDPRAEPSLRPLARSASPVIAVAAVETLGKLSDPQRVEPLIEACAHAHAEVVKAALHALEGMQDRRVISPISQALSHEAWDVRRLAADCLGRQGGDQARAVLRDRLNREHEPLVREAIGRALSAIEPPKAVRRPISIAPKAEP